MESLDVCNIYKDENGNLRDDDGTILVPVK